MAYATSADIDHVMRLQLAADLSADSGAAPDNAILDSLFSDASTYMDGFLGARYPVPVTTPAATLAILKVHCLAIGRYFAMTRSTVQKYDQASKDRFDSSERFLRDIATRKMSLAGLSDQAVPAPIVSSGASGSDERVFMDPADPDQNGML